MKILLVSNIPTHPVNAGNRWATLSTCEILQKLGCEIHFLYVEERQVKRRDYDMDYRMTLQYWGGHLYYYRINKIQGFYRKCLRTFRDRICKRHYGLYDEYPFRLHVMVNRMDQSFNYDACIVNYFFMTKLFRYIRIPQKVCYTHDSFSYRNLKVGEDCMWINASQEAKALQLCSDIFALQDTEKQYFHLLSPKSRVYSIYCKYDYHPQAVIGNRNILFLSGNNSYNQNGLDWFVRNVYPLIRETYPEVRLLIGGGICKDIEGKYEMEKSIELLGYVENVEDFYRLGDVAINPTYQGTGLKIKTFEAISYDKVTIVHPHSMEGVYQEYDTPLFASDNPKEWVNYLRKIWGDKEEILKVKKKNRLYLNAMTNHILSEYKQFLKLI